MARKPPPFMKKRNNNDKNGNNNDKGKPFGGKRAALFNDRKPSKRGK